jgi:uncharacterized delta-60 repeat protein
VSTRIFIILVLVLSFFSTNLAGEAQNSQGAKSAYLLPIVLKDSPQYWSRGILDTDFGEDGLVTSNWFGSNDTGSVSVLQPDGKLVVLGGSDAYDGYALVRYNPDGSLDTSFGSDGWAMTRLYDGTPYGMALQADQKILVVGKIVGVNFSDFYLARHNPDGSLDTSFSDDGWLSTDFARTDESGMAVTVQADDKIIAVGYTEGADTDIALVRYNPDGSLDSTFDGDGRVSTDINADAEFMKAVIVQADQKIVVAGYTYAATTDFAVARYNPDGSLDSSFAGDGILTSDFNGHANQAYAIELQTDGKILVAGYTCIETNDFALARYRADGSLDLSFSEDGWVITDFAGSDYAQAVAIQVDGKILVAGSTYDISTSYDFALARYNTDGSLDTGYDGDGLVTTDFSAGRDNRAYALVLQPDDMAVAVGLGMNGTDYDVVLARYQTDGSLDPGFDVDGLVYSNYCGSPDAGLALLVQPDSRIVVAGSAYARNKYFALARYNPDGSFDTSFGSGGQLTTRTQIGQAFALALQPDGKIIAAGYFNTGTGDFALARYHPDGSLDTSFSGDGLVYTDFGYTSDQIYSIALQADGKIVVAGYMYAVSADIAVARYNPDGSLDTTFGGGDGWVHTGLGTSHDVGYALAIQADGKIIVAGSTYVNLSYDFALVRYLPDGSLDTSFAGDGLLNTDFNGDDDIAYSMALQADGKIVLAGSTEDAYYDNDFALARYNPDGSLDTDFGDNGLVTTDLSSSDHGEGIILQADGKIVLCGMVSTGGSEYDFVVARYLPTGNLDTTFGDGSGWVATDFSGDTDHAYSVALQRDGKIVVAGYTNNGTDTDFAIARYK